MLFITKMDIYTFILLIIVLNYDATSAIEDFPVTCCQYCRSEPNLWYSLGGAFSLSLKVPATSLNDPPAYLVEDEETVQYTDGERDLKLKYAGAPVKLTYTDLSDENALVNEQYVQVDLSSPKKIGGVMIQGGFYEEVMHGVYPHKASWVTEYVVSFANSSTEFHLLKLNSGIQVFQGVASMSAKTIASFPHSVVARYVRVHPLRGQNDEGVVNRVNIRTTILTCEPKPCFNPRINCLLSEWAMWSTCGCTGMCTRLRTRFIRRVQACGGARCGDLKETESCIPPEPAWKAIVQYIGIVLGILVVIGIIAFIIYRKTHRNRVHDVIIVKDSNDMDDYDFTRSSKEREAALEQEMSRGTYKNFEDRPEPPLYNESSGGVPPNAGLYPYDRKKSVAQTAVIGGLGGMGPMDY